MQLYNIYNKLKHINIISDDVLNNRDDGNFDTLTDKLELNNIPIQQSTVNKELLIDLADVGELKILDNVYPNIIDINLKLVAEKERLSILNNVNYTSTVEHVYIGKIYQYIFITIDKIINYDIDLKTHRLTYNIFNHKLEKISSKTDIDTTNTSVFDYFNIKHTDIIGPNVQTEIIVDEKKSTVEYFETFNSIGFKSGSNTRVSTLFDHNSIINAPLINNVNVQPTRNPIDVQFAPGISNIKCVTEYNDIIYAVVKYDISNIIKKYYVIDDTIIEDNEFNHITTPGISDIIANGKYIITYHKKMIYVYRSDISNVSYSLELDDDISIIDFTSIGEIVVIVKNNLYILSIENDKLEINRSVSVEGLIKEVYSFKYLNGLAISTSSEILIIDSSDMSIKKKDTNFNNVTVLHSKLEYRDILVLHNILNGETKCKYIDLDFNLTDHSLNLLEPKDSILKPKYPIVKISDTKILYFGMFIVDIDHGGLIKYNLYGNSVIRFNDLTNVIMVRYNDKIIISSQIYYTNDEAYRSVLNNISAGHNYDTYSFKGIFNVNSGIDTLSFNYKTKGSSSASGSTTIVDITSNLDPFKPVQYYSDRTTDVAYCNISHGNVNVILVFMPVTHHSSNSTIRSFSISCLNGTNDGIPFASLCSGYPGKFLIYTNDIDDDSFEISVGMPLTTSTGDYYNSVVYTGIYNKTDNSLTFPKDNNSKQGKSSFYELAATLPQECTVQPVATTYGMSLYQSSGEIYNIDTNVLDIGIYNDTTYILYDEKVHMIHNFRANINPTPVTFLNNISNHNDIIQICTMKDDVLVRTADSIYIYTISNDSIQYKEVLNRSDVKNIIKSEQFNFNVFVLNDGTFEIYHNFKTKKYVNSYDDIYVRGRYIVLTHNNPLHFTIYDYTDIDNMVKSISTSSTIKDIDIMDGVIYYIDDQGLHIQNMYNNTNSIKPSSLDYIGIVGIDNSSYIYATSTSIYINKDGVSTNILHASGTLVEFAKVSLKKPTMITGISRLDSNHIKITTTHDSKYMKIPYIR